MISSFLNANLLLKAKDSGHHNNIPGHGCSLQTSVSLLGPSQSAPLYCGGMHSLFLVLLPPPQATEHSPQADHSLHTPSTTK